MPELSELYDGYGKEQWRSKGILQKMQCRNNGKADVGKRAGNTNRKTVIK